MDDTDDTEKPETATALIPNQPDLDSLRAAAANCTACPLYASATQTVFGEGPERAAVVFVGEQPGTARTSPAIRLSARPARCSTVASKRPD
jgi:hypothetical protein